MKKLKKGDRVIRCSRSMHWVSRKRIVRYHFSEIVVSRVGTKYAYYQTKGWPKEDRIPLMNETDIDRQSQMVCSTVEEVIEWAYQLELEDRIRGEVYRSSKLQASTKEAVLRDLEIELPQKLDASDLKSFPHIIEREQVGR